MKTKSLFALILFVTFGTQYGFSQVAIGAPPYSTIATGTFDSVNVANLNVHFEIPVFSKPGRGIPFQFNLRYDSSIWSPVTSGSTKSWQPDGLWGWSGPTDGGVGSTTYKYSLSGVCYGPDGQKYYNVIARWTWAYRDKDGTLHGFPGNTTSSDPEVCPDGPNSPNLTSTATDGSGYKIVVTNYDQAYVLSRSGNIIHAEETTSSSVTDTNGNYISTNGTSFADTLGYTVVRIAGSGTPSSPQTYTYTAPSGADAPVTASYVSRTIKTNFQCAGVNEYGPTSRSLIDRISLADQSTYQFSYEETPGYPGYYTGRIHSVTLPTGGVITYDYTGSNDGVVCADGSAARLTRTTPDGAWTYARTAGSGAAWTTVATDPDPVYHNQTRYQFQGIYQTRKESYQGSATGGTLLQTVDTCYNGNTNISTCTSTAITLPITRRTVWTALPSASGKQSKTDTYYNSYGLVTDVYEYDFGNLNSGPGGLVRRTNTVYNTALSNGIVDRPSTVTVYDGAGATKAQTTYTYDAGSVTGSPGTPHLYPVSGSRGNVTSIQYSTGSRTLTQSFTYYDTGNVNVATDINSAQTTYGYGACGNSFPTVVTLPTVNGLAMQRSTDWDCTGGVAKSTIDENGNTTYAHYSTDPYFWRPESATDAAGNITSLIYSAGTGLRQAESSLTFNGGNSIIDAVLTTDSLGRPKLSQKLHEADGDYDSTQTDYDALGRVWQQYLPFSAGKGSLAASFKGTTTAYDALGRPNSISDSGGGSVLISYPYNDIYQSIESAPNGENPKRKQFEYDALGRLTSVCEVTSASGSGNCAQTSSKTGYWTRYTYDTLGNLTGVTQNAQGTSQSRSFVYDRLSRITSETNPESGPTNYTYDSDATCGTSNGDLVRRQDAVGNVACYHYDALHRVTYISYPSGQYASATASKYFVYDSATINGTAMANPKNRLVEAYTCTSCPGTKITDLGFSYSVRGGVADAYEWTQHSGGWYHVSGTYWANGALNQLSTNISGLPAITYGVDFQGRTSTVNAGSGQSPVSSTLYNVASQVTDVTLGSGDSDHFTYDPNTGRMTQYKFTVGSTPQNLVGDLTWNANGSLGTLAITDPFNPSNSQICNYGHDDLSRITSANCGTVWSQTFAFDPFGNITKAGSLSFNPTYTTSTNRIATIPGAPAPTYDLNGNLKTITDVTSHTYLWDAEGNLIGIDGTTATYDAFGRMVELNSSGNYTQTLYGLISEKLAILNGATLTKAFIALPAGSAVYTSSGFAYYRHSEWLGSSRFASTTSRTMYSSSAYAPFGEQYAKVGANDPSFTGQHPDTTAGLYDFLLRRLSQTQGRWISPDPSGLGSARVSDPQTWNRYGYVANTPLETIDLLGLDQVNSDCLVNHINQPDGSVIVWIYCPDTGGGGGTNSAGPGGGYDPPGDDGGSSWTWTLTKSFFTFAGGPGDVPTCAGQALAHMGEILNPFSPSPAATATVAAPVAQAIAINRGVANTQAGVDAYVATRGLTVPLRSSVVRGMIAEGAEGAVAAGARANVAVQTFAIDYAAIDSTIRTSEEARSGQCASVLDLLTR